MKKPLAAALAAVAIVVAAAAPASAHVSVNPKTAEKGSYAKLTFRVPNEKDNASTKIVEVDFPQATPLSYVSVQPVPGWTFKTETATLPTPAKAEDGSSITEAVSKIVWTANAGSEVKPNEFQEFNISAGPLPSNVDSISFKALQTYTDGDVVRWIDETTTDGQEAEHPAPTLSLTASSSSEVDSSDEGAIAEETLPGTFSESSDEGSNTLAVIGLVVAVAAFATGLTALIAVRRRKL